MNRIEVNMEPIYEDVGVGESSIYPLEPFKVQKRQEDAEIPMDTDGDRSDPMPTPLPMEHMEQETAQGYEYKPLKMANVVRTAMIVRNWVLGRSEDDNRNGGPTIKTSMVIDPFMAKFSIVTNEAPQIQAQGEMGQPRAPSLTEKIKLILLKPINPTKNGYYYWTIVITIACLYNLLFILARAAFDELQKEHRNLWFLLDYLSDLIYILDMVILMKKGYLEQGLMVLIPKKLVMNYFSSWAFLVDLISVFPTDVAFIFAHYEPLIRSNRILRCRRIIDFSDRTETRTNFPNAFRISKMILLIFITFHINACLFFEISKWYGESADSWVFNYNRIVNPRINCFKTIENESNPFLDEDFQTFYNWRNEENETCRLVEYSNVSRQYLLSFYWSALTLTAIGEQPRPDKNFQYFFVTMDIILGMLIFATIVGNVGSMISNMNAAEAEFVERLDGVKQFMEYRKCDPRLRKRIGNWFGYIWSQKQSLDEGAILDQLPTKLKAELAIHVHMETLKRVIIFQDVESGLLVELVLKLRLQVFSPGDYICRKGDVGKEMYIVKRGSLNVVSDDGKTIFVTLKAGSVFGELSILNIPGNKTGNRRTANVRSVGYSDLFVLSKDDLWDALREYPEAKRILLQKGREILKKDNLIDENVKEEEEIMAETLDQKLFRLSKQLRTLEDNFDGLYQDFAQQSSVAKKRLTQLENVYKDKKKLIKRDCMRGLLLAIYYTFYVAASSKSF